MGAAPLRRLAARSHTLSPIGTNILSNLLAATWIAALTLVITPVQVKLLGIEAYGVIGLIAVLQVALSALDLGLATTVTQAIAKDRDVSLVGTSRLASSVSTFYWCASALVGTALFLSADWMASNWLKAPTLSRDLLADSIRLIAVFLALRWPVAFYGAVLSGLQRMAVLNAIKIISFTLRLGGAILVLLNRPALDAMLVWFAVSALIEVLIYATVAHRMMRTLPFRPAFHVAEIRRVWHFSTTMGLIGLLALLLTQSDRILISKLLDLQALGYYTLAYSVAVGGALLQTAINSAMLPAFAQASAEKEWASARYDKACELMAFAMAPLCAVLIFFGHDLLQLWVGPQPADGAYVPLALLAVGFFLNALASNAYTVAVGFGRPRLPFKANLAAAAIYLPLLGVLTWKAGVVGAALSWIVLNFSYFFSLLHEVHKDLLDRSTATWLRQTVLPFVLCATAAIGGAKALLVGLGSAWAIPCLVLAAVTYLTLAYRQLSPGSIDALRRLLKRQSAVEEKFIA